MQDRNKHIRIDTLVSDIIDKLHARHPSKEPGLEDTAESFGVPATADFMWSLVRNDTLDQLGQVQVKQLKNRYGNINHIKKFAIAFDRKNAIYGY